MKLARRLGALEKRIFGEAFQPTALTMPDGSTVMITGRGDYLVSLLGAAVSGRDITPVQADQLDLICRCAGSREPGGSHFVDLIRCFLLGPAGEADESAVADAGQPLSEG